MARKKILSSAPEVKEMNDTQWLFELESLYAKEEQRYEEIQVLSEVARKGLVHILGLNLMPVEEKIPFEERDKDFKGVIGEEKVFTRLRQPEDNEFIPLSILMGREEIISEIIKRQQELNEQEEMIRKEEAGEVVQMTPEELDAFMNKDLDEGDLMFIDSSAELEKKLIWESEETQKLNSLLVRPLTEKDNDLILGGKDTNVVSSPRGSKLPNRKKSRVTLE